ncbi:unnamed protein product [Cyprideis torosa]|uniref:Uncharacterized protein n=1 Tax=Cyprideis torosa TaxID=163714 RepID=A0A7R8ZMY7_9CRUS|nr:unnamed protein product [Cyprideis torosa]CAG0885418.1 unnamed protein product [Cyprideis torosa]
MGHGQSQPEPEPQEAPKPRKMQRGLKATVFPNPQFDVEAACEELNKSMKGWGTDEDTLVQVLVRHSNQQRQEIKEKYMAMYGEDLVDQIKGEVDGHFQDFLVGLLTPTLTYEAQCLQDAMKGAGTNEDVLIEVLVGKSNEEIAQLKEEYQKLTEDNLDEKVESELSGIFQNIIRALLAGARDEGWGDRDEAEADAQVKKQYITPTIDSDKTRDRLVNKTPNEAICLISVVVLSSQELVEAGISNWGTDESKFNAILCSKSFPHLSMVFRRYAELSGEDITETIESEFSGNAKDALLAIIKEARDTPEFFAERLHNAMDGAGTTDYAVIRILITRSEVDLGSIKDRYQELYEEPLVDKIKGETRGDYETACILVLGEQPE